MDPTQRFEGLSENQTLNPTVSVLISQVVLKILDIDDLLPFALN